MHLKELCMIYVLKASIRNNAVSLVYEHFQNYVYLDGTADVSRAVGPKLLYFVMYTFVSKKHY